MKELGMVFLLYYVIFPALCIVGVKKQTVEKEVLLTIDDSNFGKGIAACGVFLAHVYPFIVEKKMCGKEIFFPFSFLGGMGVLLFFFVGGYGIFKSYKNKGNLNGYWKKRFMNVYVPSIIIEAIFSIIKYIFLHTGNFKSILQISLFGAWYIDVVMLQYAFFFFGICVFKNKIERVLVWMLGCNTIAFIAFTEMNLNERWRNGLLLFIFGIFVAWKEEKIIQLIKQKWLQLIIFSTGLFAVTGGIFTVGKGTVWADLFKNLSGCFMAMLLICVLWKIHFGSRVMQKIGKRSMYVYLVYFEILELVQKNWVYVDFGVSVKVYFLLISTLVVSEIFYRILNVRVQRVK
jgi:fucose 4-O-acetylase-like acetyltransferase